MSLDKAQCSLPELNISLREYLALRNTNNTPRRKRRDSWKNFSTEED